MKKVVLLGFKGDCAARYYNPVLFKLAEEQEIELICVDYGNPVNVRAVPTPHKVEELIKQGTIRYLDLNQPKDQRAYAELTDIDLAFVVTWDKNHCMVARDFLDRAEIILIEKPLDAFLRNVFRYLPEANSTNLLAFDHYVAKFHPLLTKISRYLEEIGQPGKVDFRLLEPISIPSHRIQALDRGMIYDLLPHGLAVIEKCLNRELLKDIEISRVKAARYCGAPIRGDTYASVEINSPLQITVKVGKAIGWEAEKTLIMEGSRGTILVDIDRFRFSVENKSERKDVQGELLRGFGDIFIKELINGTPELAPGVIPLTTAKQILLVLDEAEHRIHGQLPVYLPGATVSEIESL